MARHHIDELAREIEEARRSHAARDEIEQSLTHERDELRTEVVALRAEAGKVAPLASEVERLGRDLTAREQEVAKLVQQVRTAETALAASTAELERRAAIERRLDADRDRLTVAEAAARDRVAALERELGAMTAEARTLRGRLDVAASELERLSQRMIGRLARRLVRR
jgi:DNA repair exonuclease SbcCD ATPase subunit